MARPPIKRVTVAELRELFNREILPKVSKGELIEIVRSEGTPQQRANQPAGTRSQIVEYFGSAGGHLEKVAIVHRYLRPDGSLGGSGKPDPKRILHDGIMFAPQLKKPAS
jgi:hypothetical protein